MAELYQVEFKGSRREFFQNTYHHTLKVPDYVIVQAEQGEDAGRLTRKIPASETLRARSILRPFGREDRSKLDELRQLESKYKRECFQLIRRHGLIMKIVDVEIQFDNSKITFYFTADHRVDFRSLVRDLAAKYRTRIELRQIGVRDEARRIDGYGICGRQQCCNTHIKDFLPISTQHAREQDLSLNPSKISGNCGRLLCCLRYEVEMYAGVKKRFPQPGALIKTNHGTGIVERVDYFKEEAIIRVGDDNAAVRVRAEDIIHVETPRAARHSSNQPDFVSDVDLEALKKLEDPQ